MEKRSHLKNEYFEIKNTNKYHYKRILANLITKMELLQNLTELIGLSQYGNLEMSEFPSELFYNCYVQIKRENPGGNPSLWYKNAVNLEAKCLAENSLDIARQTNPGLSGNSLVAAAIDIVKSQPKQAPILAYGHV